MPELSFRVHAIIQMEERGIGVEDARRALETGKDIEARPDEHPYPARLVLGWWRHGALHIAVHDNIGDDEIVVETVYEPDPALWEPGWETRRRKPG